MNLPKMIGGATPGVDLLQAIVVDDPSGGTCTIRFGDLASTTTADDIPGVHYLASTDIANGDTVWVLQTGGALLVIGPVALRRQFGSSVVTTDGAGRVTITFPTAFPVAPQCIVVVNGDRNQGVFWCSIVQTPTTTSFVVQLENSGGAIVTTTVRLNWMAST